VWLQCGHLGGTLWRSEGVVFAADHAHRSFNVPPGAETREINSTGFFSARLFNNAEQVAVPLGLPAVRPAADFSRHS
jgi:hypothetical protein